jgi:hypothetical protein
MSWLVNTTIDGAAQVLDEGAVETGIDLADPEIPVDDDARGLHCS